MKYNANFAWLRPGLTPNQRLVFLAVVQYDTTDIETIAEATGYSMRAVDCTLDSLRSEGMDLPPSL